MRQSPWSAFTAAALLLSAPLSAQSVSYTQSDFADLSGWVQTSLGGGSLFSIEAMPTGGNDGSYLRHTLSTGAPFSGVRTVVQLFTNPTWTFNPAMLGAMDRIEVAFDLASFGGFSNNPGGFFRPLIKQGTSIFALAPSTQASQSTWQSVAYASSAAADWTLVTGSGALDWSATGAIMEFGWRYALQVTCSPSTATCNDPMDRSGFDNFAVRTYAERPVTPVPEPSTTALLAVGLFLSGLVAKKRRAV